MDSDPTTLTPQEDRLDMVTLIVLAVSFTLGLALLAGVLYGILSGFKPLPEITS